jgi:hypothetical protein
MSCRSCPVVTGSSAISGTGPAPGYMTVMAPSGQAASQWPHLMHSGAATGLTEGSFVFSSCTGILLGQRLEQIPQPEQRVESIRMGSIQSTFYVHVRIIVRD